MLVMYQPTLGFACNWQISSAPIRVLNKLSNSRRERLALRPLIAVMAGSEPGDTACVSQVIQQVKVAFSVSIF